jgi:hypothetical protein
LVGREWQPLQEEPLVGPFPPYGGQPFDRDNFENTDDGTEDKEDEGTDGSENLNVLHLLYTIAQVVLVFIQLTSRTKRIRMDLYIGESHAISVTRNLFEVFDITV